MNDTPKQEKTQHTPGPWEACEKEAWQNLSTKRWCMRINNAMKGAAAYASAATQSEATANARLIAAAPELLAALERTLALAIGHACEARKINADECESWSWVQTARAAIAKARGE